MTAMATEVLYDEAEPFQTACPAVQQPLRDIYSNCGELNMADYCNTEACIRNLDATIQELSQRLDTPDREQEDNISNNPSSTSGDGISSREDIVDEPESAEKDRGHQRTYEVPVSPWNVKLRNNWRRQLKRRAAHANDQKSKKNDHRQSIGGSLSRSVEHSHLTAFFRVE